MVYESHGDPLKENQPVAQNNLEGIARDNMGDRERWVQDQITLNTTYMVLVGICLGAIIARIYVRITLQGNSVLKLSDWRWSDRLIVITWIGFTSCGIMNLYIFAGLGFTPQTIGEHLGEPEYMTGKRLGYAFLVTFWLWMFVIKGAWLCFFNEFVRKESLYKSWVAIRMLGGLVVVGGASTFIYSNVWCLPISRQWSNGDDFCWLDTNARYRWMYWRQIWHAALDVLILSVPLWLLSLLHNVPLQARLSAGFMFALGIILTAISVIYLALVVHFDNGITMPRSIEQFLYFEPIVELAAAIIIQCMPAIRVLLTSRRQEMAEKLRRKDKGNRGQRSVVELWQKQGRQNQGESQTLSKVSDRTLVDPNDGAPDKVC